MQARCMMQTQTAPVDTTYLPADEALFLGAAVAHISAYYETRRQARIARQNRMAYNAMRRRGEVR